jgi:uncharacterized protein (TIGR00156 family)
MIKINKSIGILVFLLFLVFIGKDLYTQENRSGGFGANLVTVAEALRLRDDTRVILQGKIERHIRSEYYLFADETGNIRIEIPPRVWGSLNVTQNDIIEITGIIDRHLFTRNRVYVRNIRIL